jgi:cytidylate kinase
MRARDARDGVGFGRLQITPETIVIRTEGRTLEDVIAEAVRAVESALQKRGASGKLSE